MKLPWKPILIFPIAALAWAPAAFSESCSTVQVHSSFRAFGNHYRQNGVGWVIESPSGDRKWILTPQHVISGAQSITVSCGAQSTSATLHAESIEGDLALLRVDATSLPPLQAILREGEHAPKILNGSVVIHAPEKTLSSPTLFTFHRDSRWGEPDPLPAYATFGQTALVGVYPGLSGSPVWGAGQAIAGMVVKTRINGAEALLIPAREITQALPALIRGKDPFAGSWGGTIQTQNTLATEPGKLLRSRSITIHVDHAPALTLQEVCPLSEFTPTSEWEDVGVKGDWGDGGGDHGASRNFGAVAGELGHFALYAPYKGGAPCSVQGLRFADGRILQGLWDREKNRAHRIDDLESLATAIAIDPSISQGLSDPDFLSRRGIFAPSPPHPRADLEPFCNSQNIAPTSHQFLQLGRLQWADLGGTINQWFVREGELRYFGSYQLGFARKDLSENKNSGDWAGSILCRGPSLFRTSPSIQLKTQSLLAPLQPTLDRPVLVEGVRYSPEMEPLPAVVVTATLTESETTARFDFGSSCRIQAKVPRVSVWDTWIDQDGLQAILKLRPGSNALSVQILNVPERCRKGQQLQPWLLRLEHYGQSAGSGASPRSSDR